MALRVVRLHSINPTSALHVVRRIHADHADVQFHDAFLSARASRTIFRVLASVSAYSPMFQTFLLPYACGQI
jgi:hypothetical protein